MRRREFLFTPAAAAAAAESPARPRLYFNRAQAGALRSRKEGDWAKVLERARRLLESRLVAEDVAERGGGQHANYGQPGGQISEMGLTLGLAWHVTGEKQYAEKLRDAMLHYSGYKRWYGQGLDDRVPAWHSELNTARFCYGFGAGYDAVRDFLTGDERKEIADGMVRLGILPTLDDWVLPEKRIHALDSMGHNWWAVCVSMAGVACLALVGDDERAEEWVDRVSRGLALWFNYRGDVLQNKSITFDRAGAFYEGVGYANYALGEYLKYRLAYGNAFPNRRQTRFRSLEQATDFFLQTFYPAAGSFYTINFGDSGLHVSSSRTVKLLVETGFAHPAAGWYLTRAGEDRAGIDPLDVLAAKRAPAAGPEKLPLSVIYRDIGWAVLRSSWQDNATMLAVKSGFTWNHTHADAGSFVLFHQGMPLIADSGSCSYSDPLYGGYYVQSRAHNVILWNGEGEPREDIRRGVKTPGAVHSLLDGLGVRYVYADATGPMSRYCSRNYRHWVWIGGAILVFDDVLAHEAGRLDWLLHYQGTGAAHGAGVVLTNGSAQAEVRMLYPAEAAVREEMGYADHKSREQMPYFVFSPKTAAREQKFVTAILPYPAAAEVELLSAPLAVGARVRSGGETTDVYLNLQADGRRMHENSNNTIDGWETDAYLLAVTQPGPRYFVACGSYLRRGGRVLLDSLSKVDAVWRPGSKVEAAIGGQEEIEVGIGVEGRPGSVVVNGRGVEFQYSGRTGLAGVRIGRE